MSIRAMSLASFIIGLLVWGAGHHAFAGAWLAVGIETAAALSFWLYMMVEHWRVMDLIRGRDA